MPIHLHVWGPRACFARPEFTVERVSYDVMTPMAARGIFEAIHWKPAIRWQIERIHILRPIAFKSIFGESELPRGDRADTRRAAIILTDVAYVIEAGLSLTDRAGIDDNEAMHIRMFTRRAQSHRVFQQPSLGMPDFPAHFSLLRENEPLPETQLCCPPHPIDLGWMLHDIDYENGRVARFFRAEILGGVISVPPLDSPELAA